MGVSATRILAKTHVPCWATSVTSRVVARIRSAAALALACLALMSCSAVANLQPDDAPKSTPPQSASARPEPLVGLPFSDSQEGFGQVRPGRLNAGGSPAGLVDGIKWESYGGATATGTGRALYVPSSGVVPTPNLEPVILEATDLGECKGVWIYRTVRWTFPDHPDGTGEFRDICTYASEYAV